MEAKSKFWKKFFKRKKGKTWKTDGYFGLAQNELFRGHVTISGGALLKDKITDGEIYYLRDICGNTLINRDESGKNINKI